MTGASAGIGRELALLLARDGFHLVLSARDEGRLRELAAELEARWGTTSTIIPCDLAAPDGAGALASTKFHSPVTHHRPPTPRGQKTASAMAALTVVAKGTVEPPGQGVAGVHEPRNGSSSQRRRSCTFSSPLLPSGIVPSGPKTRMRLRMPSAFSSP